jgi:hypothetical protein
MDLMLLVNLIIADGGLPHVNVIENFSKDVLCGREEACLWSRKGNASESGISVKHDESQSAIGL